ncbi:hypothetical protein ACRDU6_15915 [Mycolicibacterium sp. ELW1]
MGVRETGGFMSIARRGAHFGVFALLLGLAWVGLQTAGVAGADSSNADSPTTAVVLDLGYEVHSSVVAV